MNIVSLSEEDKVRFNQIYLKISKAWVAKKYPSEVPPVEISFDYQEYSLLLSLLRQLK